MFLLPMTVAKGKGAYQKSSNVWIDTDKSLFVGGWGDVMKYEGSLVLTFTDAVTVDVSLK